MRRELTQMWNYSLETPTCVRLAKLRSNPYLLHASYTNNSCSFCIPRKSSLSDSSSFTFLNYHASFRGCADFVLLGRLKQKIDSTCMWQLQMNRNPIHCARLFVRATAITILLQSLYNAMSPVVLSSSRLLPCFLASLSFTLYTLQNWRGLPALLGVLRCASPVRR